MFKLVLFILNKGYICRMNAEIAVEKTIQLKEITFCKYQLTTVNKEMILSFPQLLQLRQRVKKLTRHHSLENIIDTNNFVLLFIADKQHLVYLDIPQLLWLNDEVERFFSNFKSILI